MQALLWEIEAKDQLGGARDALKASQRLIPAVPLTVQQATLVQVDGSYNLDAAPLPMRCPGGRPAPGAAAQTGRGPARRARLVGPTTRLPAWSKNQQSRGPARRQALANRGGATAHLSGRRWPGQLLPAARGRHPPGSDTLTAYLLAATHEAASINPAFALPGEVRAPMERGLIAFVEGRIERNFWSPRKDLDMRKLAAIEALSRYGKAQGRMLASVTIAPNQWPTHSVIDWMNILRRVQDIPERDKRLQEATQILRARLSYQGTKLLLQHRARRLLVVADAERRREPCAPHACRDGQPRLEGRHGPPGQRFHRPPAGRRLAHHHRQPVGGLALEKFSARFEATPVSGTTKAAMGSHTASVDWSKVERIKPTDAGRCSPPGQRVWCPAAPGMLRGNAMFLPWGAAGGKERPVRHPPGAGQALAHAAVGGCGAAQGAVQCGLQHPENRYTHRTGQQGLARRPVHARRRAAHHAGSHGPGRHDLGPSPTPFRAAPPFWQRPGARLRDRHPGRKRSGAGWPAFEERSFEAFRSYYEYPPKGTVKMEYTVRLNNVGDFALPPAASRPPVRARNVWRGAQRTRTGSGCAMTPLPSASVLSKCASGCWWRSVVLPVAIYAVLLVRRAISRTTVVLFGLVLVLIAGLDVYLLQG